MGISSDKIIYEKIKTFGFTKKSKLSALRKIQNFRLDIFGESVYNEKACENM